MKRGLIGRGAFILILFIFLSSGVFAAPPASGTCSIVPRADCVDAGAGVEGFHIVMSLSSSTNAHGEFPDLGSYPYVLCCNFGTGDKVCKDVANKIIGLSSDTNAHAQQPALKKKSDS